MRTLQLLLMLYLIHSFKFINNNYNIVRCLYVNNRGLMRSSTFHNMTSIQNDPRSSLGEEKLNELAERVKRFELVRPIVYVSPLVNNETITSVMHPNGSIPAFITLELKDYIFNLKLQSVQISNGSCYYHGEVAGDQSSVATFNACSGLRGEFNHSSNPKDQIFVEPLYEKHNGSLNDPHILYYSSDINPSPDWNDPSDIVDYDNNNGRHRKCQEVSWENNIEKFGSRRFRRNHNSTLKEPYDSSPSTKYLELYVVNDYSQFVKYNSDYWAVVERTKEIVKVINSIYRKVGVYIVLVGVEVWTDRSHIAINGNSSQTLNAFLTYRKYNISKKGIRHDNAQLIIASQLGDGVIGKAPIRTLCSYESSAAVNEDRHSNPGAIATTIAHELGHNFGLQHDVDTCHCPDDQCIMSSAGGGFTTFDHWSDCSLKKFNQVFTKGLDYCMHDLPYQTFSSMCGNGFKEENEDCDCGLEQDCNNPCCIALTCKFAVNATCATGKCCNLETCQFREAGTECRSLAVQCDLPEYCNGFDEYCPSDAFLHNGASCRVAGEDSYCYKGECLTYNSQCRKIWGHTGQVSKPICFEHFNVLGGTYGHCGYNWADGTSLKCMPEEVMCGMLHCEHNANELAFWYSSLTLTLPDTYLMIGNEKIVCKAAIMDVGLFMKDPGLVRDGTKCGPNSVCVSQRCVNVSIVDPRKCPENCNNNGVCNNFGQCHCYKGWAPPLCKTKGQGGSEHSGSPLNYDLPTEIVVLICFVCFLVVPGIIIIAIILWRKRKRVKEVGVNKWHQCLNSFQRYVRSCSKSSKPQKVTNIAEQENLQTSHLLRSNSTTRKQGSSLNRVPSFRPEDIGKPQLQSSTNNNLTVLSQTTSEKSTNQIFRPQRPKLPAAIHSSSSFSHKEKVINEQIYANQITRNTSFNILQKNPSSPSQCEEKLLQGVSSDDIPNCNPAYDEDNQKSPYLQKMSSNSNGAAQNGAVPKQKYENVDDIIHSKVALHGKNASSVKQTMPTSRLKQSNNKQNKVTNNSSNEYKNLPLKSQSSNETDRKHSSQEIKSKNSLGTDVSSNAKKARELAVKVSSLRENFQVQPQSNDSKNAPVRPKPTYTNLKA